MSTVVCMPNQAKTPGYASSQAGTTFTNNGAGTFGGNGDVVNTNTTGTTSNTLSIPANPTSGTAGVTVKSSMQAEADYSISSPNSNVQAGAATRVVTGGYGNDNFNNQGVINNLAVYNFGVADSSGKPVKSGSVSFSFSTTVQPPTPGTIFGGAPVVINVTTNYYTILSPNPNTGRGIAVFLGAGAQGTRVAYDPDFGGAAGQNHTFTATLPNLPLATTGNFVNFGSAYGIGLTVPVGTNLAQSGASTDQLSFNYGETIQSSTTAQTAVVASGAAGPAILIPLDTGSSAVTPASVQSAIGLASPALAGRAHRAVAVLPSLGTSDID